MSIKTGGPAFPQQQVFRNEDGTPWFEGATMRDYFAAKAMPFEVKDYWDDFAERKDQTIDEFWREEVAESCYAIADAMLRAREAE
jgi:hypothetical protein